MMEILKKAKEETLVRAKEQQKLVDEAGGWDRMTKLAKQSEKAMFREFMKDVFQRGLNK